MVVVAWPSSLEIISASAGPTDATALRHLRSLATPTGGSISRPLRTNISVDGPEWSPDGKTLLVARARRLVVVNRNGKVVQTLVSLPRGFSPSFPAWQPLP